MTRGGGYMGSRTNRDTILPGGDTLTLLRAGTLAVPTFNDDDAGMSKAEIALFPLGCRRAGACSHLGPARMDRGEPHGGGGVLLPCRHLR